MRIAAVFAMIVSVLALLGQVAGSEELRSQRAREEAAEGRIQIRYEGEPIRARITIQAQGNRVAWSDVARGLARARGYDDSALDGLLPSGSFDISGKGWRVASRSLNLALPSGVHIATEQPEDDSPRLAITLDRAALLASERRFKALLRTGVLWKHPGRQSYGLILPEGWEKAPAEQNLVVIVHGLDSYPERFETLTTALKAAGLPHCGFRYPNDQPIASSARRMSSELKRLARQQPNRGVALVTHSMGGLVAREMVENPDLDPGNVRRLIMVSPPNHGSALAPLGFALDLWEHLVDDARRNEANRFYAMVEDGLSEAADDLQPGSPFLLKLNARPRNPKVRYTIFLGDSAPLRSADLASVRASISKAGQRARWVRFFGPRLQERLADLDEVVEGKGDGAVSLARGRLEGVDDTQVLHFTHLGGGPDAPKVVEEIVKRLKAG